MQERVTRTIDGAVAVITMDDGKVNALSPSMQAEINEHLDAVEADDSIRSIVIAGRPGVFSAGFDLGVMAGGDMAAIIDMVASGGELVRRVYGLPKPVVAAATGHAIAAGAFLLLGCDIRIGIDTREGGEGAAKIGMNEVAIGMAVPNWAIVVASHRLSNRHLNRSLLNARITDGPTALDVGFLDEVVDPQSVVETAIEHARALVDHDVASYVEMIDRYRGSTLQHMAHAIETERASVRGTP